MKVVGWVEDAARETRAKSEIDECVMCVFGNRMDCCWEDIL